MNKVLLETREGILKLTAVDECYASVKLLLAHIKEQDLRIRLLEVKLMELNTENKPLKSPDLFNY